MLFKKLFIKKASDTDEPPQHIRIGMIGEEAACKHLKRIGLSTVTRNYHARGGEIDIIAEDPHTLVFVEVKTRTSEHDSPYGRPSDAVNQAKRENIIRASKEFVRLYCKSSKKRIRFDVIEVYVSKVGKITDIVHIKDAFSAY